MFVCVVSVIICNHCFSRVSFSINALLLLDIVVLLILVNKRNTPIKHEHACYCHGLTHTVHHDNIRCTVWGWKVLKVIESWKPMSLCQVQECPVRQWRGWPAAAAALWHCEGRLPKARSRISHPTTIIVKLSCSPVTNLSSCPLSGVVTIQTLSFSSTTMTVTEQRQIFPLLFGKNTCIWERGERTMLKKWREWLQACDKVFPVSHLQWGHFPTFLDTISSLSRSDILKSKNLFRN